MGGGHRGRGPDLMKTVSSVQTKKRKKVTRKSQCPGLSSNGVGISASFRMWKISRVSGRSLKRKITSFPSNPHMSGSVINGIYLIFYLTFKISLWFGNLLHTLPENKAQKDENTCWQSSGEEGFERRFTHMGCLNTKPLLFPHGLHCFCECFPRITYGNEKLNINETSFWVCTLAKLSSSAIYVHLCHWWLEYIAGGKMSNFSCLLCFDVKKIKGKMYVYIL